MGNCKICGKPKNVFMQSKFVCLHCDELLFDMEIEVEAGAPKKKTVPVEAKPKQVKLLRLVEKPQASTDPKKEEAESVETKEEDTKTKKAA